MEQCVDQRAIKIARRRVDDQPGGLVYHDEMRILIDDIERNILCDGLGGRRRGEGDKDALASGDLCGGITQRSSIRTGNLPTEDERFHPLSGKRGDKHGQRLVQPRAGKSLVDNCRHSGTSIPHGVGMWG